MRINCHSQLPNGSLVFFFLSHNPNFKVVRMPLLRTVAPIESTIHGCVRLTGLLVLDAGLIRLFRFYDDVKRQEFVMSSKALARV